MKQTLTYTLLLLTILAGPTMSVHPLDSLYVSVDTSRATYCDQPEARQFDFWLGEWDLTWSEADNIGRGTNVVTSELRECMIFESFAGQGGDPFIGRSISVFHASSGRWKQTWIDNRGGYLDFVGGWEDDRMILRRDVSNDSLQFSQRMVWFDITKNSLEWKWERSDDNGETWQTLWNIHYVRKK